jgi:beta-aspartyl-peptidase (threonine type)
MESKAEADYVQGAEYAMVIHGGAGTILKKNMTEEKEAAYTAALNEALSIGENILKNGGTSLDAVVSTIKFMEDSPLFNAGKGAVFAHDGRNMLDASIMQGRDMNAGAIAGVTNVKNPITGAVAVMQDSDHVLLSGKGAEEFCEIQRLEIVDNQYFFTKDRYQSLQRILEKEKSLGYQFDADIDSKFGTVGAVALDINGNIVAGTSTGGMTNKRYDRIGDSPIIGAGTYANNKTCGVSCTGHGEYFIRYAVAHDVSAMMEYKGATLEEASDYIVNEKLLNAGGSGGLISLDKKGNVAMSFNTAGMYRGYVNDTERYIGIYKE